MELLAFFTSTRFVEGFAALNTIWLALVAGVSASMSVFIIPIIRDGGGSSRVMTRQFDDLITKGNDYLQTSSRVQGLTLSIATYLLYTHPDRHLAARWIYFAAALLIVMQVAWYEIVAVFPANRRILDIEKLVTEHPEKDAGMKAEVLELLDLWKRRHIGRLILPLFGAGVAIYGLL